MTKSMPICAFNQVIIFINHISEFENRYLSLPLLSHNFHTYLLLVYKSKTKAIAAKRDSHAYIYHLGRHLHLAATQKHAKTAKLSAR